ncbi:SOS response-associated peptidase family protein [Sphingosinicella sp. CPCC 101087]|uniref:SOS response-associated peptidase family protein n=1 Tax=Sphingosinicella sp. CPCC 101087 TaxID=2497754 RepID=UPI00101BDFFC|nr:SOS response-associated peptidase family protein [Sphingosinicella sp. CPCC 101087]
MCNEQRRRIALGQVREDWSQIRIPLIFPEGMPNFEPLDSIRITDRNAIIRAARESESESVEPGASTAESAPESARGPSRGEFEAERFPGPSRAELVVRRWSWPGPRGKPVYNYRSEGREFPRGRCLIVADGFYEFTAPADPAKKRKDKWLFTLAGAEWFCIAGLWRNDPQVGEAYTMLTCAPGPDVAPYHDRQVVVLDRDQWARWLDPAVPAGELLQPLPAGSLEVEQVG